MLGACFFYFQGGLAVKKLNKKKAKKLLAVLGTSATLAGVGMVTFINARSTQPVTAAVKAKVKYVDDATFKKGSDIAFDLTAQVPTDKDIKKLMIYDKLEPVFQFNKVRVFDGDTDVTDEGKTDFDKTTNTVNWLAKDPSKWYGKKLTIRPEVTLKDNADLSKYLDKNTNQYNIPNIGDMVVNDETTPSNKVQVHTPNDKEPTAVKSIKDKDGKWGTEAKYEQGEEFSYQVKYTIPKNGKDLSNIEFSDDLEDAIDLSKVQIVDDKGNDITKSEGTLSVDNDKESFNWQPSKEYLPKMTEHEYTVNITAKVKTDADLSKYLDPASKEYKIPNIAHMKYNNKDIPSNPVNVVTPPPVENKVTKTVKGLSGSYKQDSDNVEVGKDYTYKIDFEPGAGQNLKDVEFTDDLEDVLDLEKVVVQNESGKDITDSEGTLKVDDKEESFNWQPKDDLVKTMGGKKFSVIVTAKVKKDADLQKYLKNNEIQIPNTAHMKANGKDTPSNTPVVTPKVEEPKAKKGIVKNPSDWTKFFGNKSETSAGQDTDNTKINSSTSTEPKVWKDTEKYIKRNSQGAWVKADSKVTDKQFEDALKKLSEPQPIGKNDATAQDPGVTSTNDGSTSTSTPVSSADLKSLIGATTVESNTAARGDAVDYLLTFEIGNQNNMKSLVLSDNLEDVLDLKNVVIIDSDGNNITNEGQLTTSDEDESFTWTAKDPEKYSGKTLYVAIASNIKKDADLSDYNGKSIPNTGHLVINGKDTPTNEVKTKLNGTADPNSPDNPDNPNSDLHGDGSNNPITGKNGVLPKTGHFIMHHVWQTVAVLVAALGGLFTYAYKKRIFPFNKLNKKTLIKK